MKQTSQLKQVPLEVKLDAVKYLNLPYKHR